MQELLGQLTAASRGMWRFRWHGLVVAWSVAVVGALVVARLPNRYEADARIYVDTQSMLKPLMSGLAFQPNIEQQVVMLSRTLLSRPNIEKLIRVADADLSTRSKLEQEALIESMTERLKISSTQRDNLYTLSFRDTDPKKAQRVIQSLVSIFVESSLGSTRTDSNTARAFIDEQIKNYEDKLDEAEKRLKEFRLRNLELQAPDGQDAATRLAQASAQLSQARLELREAENARDSARAQLASAKGESADIGTQSLLQESALAVSTPEIDARIEAQKRNLDTLLQRYTDQHPDVASARRMIEELERQRQKELQELRKAAAAAATPGAATAVPNLAAQELGRLLASAEVTVASLRARVGEYAARYERARALLKTAPEIEAEAAQLNRDYAVHKKNYDDLVSRREAAALSVELEGASGVADFRLIDPPRVSQRPVAPNRLLLLPLVFAASVAAGLAVAFLLSQLRPVFNGAKELRERFNLPVIGMVSALVSDADRRRERGSLIRFSLASAGMVVVFAGGLLAVSTLGL